MSHREKKNISSIYQKGRCGAAPYRLGQALDQYATAGSKPTHNGMISSTETMRVENHKKLQGGAPVR